MLVRMAARSPGRSMAGPLVVWMLTPSSSRDDVGQGGLAQAGRPVEQHVVGRLLAHVGRGQQDGQVLLDLGLADVLLELARPQDNSTHVLVECLYLRRDQSGVVIHGRRSLAENDCEWNGRSTESQRLAL